MKPVSSSARKHVDKKRKQLLSRIRLILFAVILAGVGLLRLRGGILVVRHFTGQPMFSWGLIAGGIVCILLAIVPLSWVQKAAETGVLHHPSRR